MPRETNNNEFYWTNAWRKKRNAHIKKFPLCTHCLARGIGEPGVIVDHIIEIEDNPSLKLTTSNLQTLCQSCHNKKTAAEARKREGVILRASDVMNWVITHNKPKT